MTEYKRFNAILFSKIFYGTSKSTGIVEKNDQLKPNKPRQTEKDRDDSRDKFILL